jgi:peroxiredoxin Q/BCP
VLDIGSRAPEFTLPCHSGVEISLTTLLNQGPLLLYFYPSDFSAPCTRQACSVRDIHPNLRADGLLVAGISPQSPDSHEHFRQRNSLPFPLLADEGKSVIRMYEANGPMGMRVRRVTYLIDQGRIIRNATVADFRTATHTEFMLGARIWLDATAPRSFRAA